MTQDKKEEWNEEEEEEEWKEEEESREGEAFVNLCTTFWRLRGRARLDETMVPGDRLLQRYIKARKRLNAYEGIDENMELQVR